MRYWTVAEAQDYLPRLRGLLDEIRRFTGAPAKVRTNGHGRLSGTTTSANDPEGGTRQGREAAAAAVAELEALSIVLRDPGTGLVDFPALGEDGVVYYLCWREDDGGRIGWWHRPEDGIAGRKPLPRTEPGEPGDTGEAGEPGA